MMIFPQRRRTFVFSFIPVLTLLLHSFRIFATEQSSEFGIQFITWPTWNVVAPGKEVELRCSTNLPPDGIKWLHNHEFIQPFRDEYNSSQSVNIYKLNHGALSGIILKISENKTIYKKQEGLYQCVAAVGAIMVTSLPGHVQVAFLEPFNSETSNRTIQAKVSSAFKIPCQRPLSLPQAVMHFYKNGKLINLYQEKKFFVTHSGDLIVVKADLSSRGWYSCRAHNEVLNMTVKNHGYTRVSVSHITVSDNSAPPHVVVFDSVLTTFEGNRERLLCLVKNTPVQSIYWSFQNAIPPQYMTSQSSAVVVLRNVSAEDNGLYRCHAKNDFGSSFVDVTVLVQDAPYNLANPRSESVSQGSNISLTCEFGGNPAPTIAWVFNGKLLASNGNIHVDGNVLNFHSIEKAQAGVYQCFGFNPFGAAQGIAVLTVIPKTVTATPAYIDTITNASGTSTYAADKRNVRNRNVSDSEEIKRNSLRKRMIAPSRPNITKLSDESAMVTWDVNSEDNIPILFFKVQYKTVKGPELISHHWKTVDEDIPAHIKSTEVTGLKTDRVYKFRVAAVYVNNDNQFGPSSKKFFLTRDIKLKSPETAPSITSISPTKSNSSVFVFWKYDASAVTEGFIISYREAASAVHYTKITLLGKERRNYTVNYLLPNVPYDFRISSFNMAGTSGYSNRFTYVPQGINYTAGRSIEEQPSLNIPVVRSDPDGVSNSVLYIALGTGLSSLLVIVVVSFTLYSCKHKNAPGEEAIGSKFVDTSLRIHRSSISDSPQQAVLVKYQSSVENEEPLIAIMKTDRLATGTDPFIPNFRTASLPNNKNKCKDIPDRSGS